MSHGAYLSTTLRPDKERGFSISRKTAEETIRHGANAILIVSCCRTADAMVLMCPELLQITLIARNNREFTLTIGRGDIFLGEIQSARSDVLYI